MTDPPCSIAPWLTIKESLKALAFYKEAFKAKEVYRLDVPDGVIARLSINGAEFWLSDGASSDAGPTEGPSIRMILTVPNPDLMFEQAVRAGAKVVFPMNNSHGWRVGRVEDPFGHHWEIGRET